MIDLVALRSLLAIEAHGSVVAAAALTGYTPSAVSQQIKRMERDLGFEVLERVGRGVVLTERGRTLVGHGHDIVRQVEAAMSGVQAQGGVARGLIRVAAFSTAVRGLVAPLITELASTAPEIEVELCERDPSEAVEMLVSGQADLAIVHHWIGVPLHRPDHLEGVLLGQDVADLLVHRDHRLAAAGSVTPADLLAEPWASTPVGSICHAWFSYMFAGMAPQPRIRFWSGEFASHTRLVAEGVAVALVPRLGRGPLPAQVVAVPLNNPVPTRVIEVLWRTSMSSSPSIRHLRERLFVLFAQPQ